MTFNQTSSIRFSVEESVWFKKGQEVSDLIGISLEPEISVQEHENYISIRGALVLSGEYHPQAREGEEQEIHSLRDSAIYRTVDEVIESDDGNLTMKHRFPIDITIPTNRIRSLEDVYVLVESFDYEIPDTGKLELKADLCISGIASEKESSLAAQRQSAKEQEQQVVNEAQEVRGGQYVQDVDAEEIPESVGLPEEQEVRGESGVQTNQVVQATISGWESIEAHQAVETRQTLEEQQPEKEEENTLIAFTTEVRKQANEDETADDENVTEAPESPIAAERAEVNLTVVSKVVPSPNDVVEADQVEELDIAERPIGAEAEEVVEAVVGAEAEALVEEAAIPVNIVAKKRSPQIEMKGRSEQKDEGWNPKSLYGAQQATYNSSGARENVQEEAEKQAEHQRSKRTENALYLTKMLSDGEEDFSKLRLRIVQNGETLGTIAETYDISTNQIIRLNALDDEIVKEGQILYIPAYAGVEK